MLQDAIDGLKKARDDLQAQLDDNAGDVGDAGAAIVRAITATDALLEALEGVQHFE